MASKTLTELIKEQYPDLLPDSIEHRLVTNKSSSIMFRVLRADCEEIYTYDEPEPGRVILRPYERFSFK